MSLLAEMNQKALNLGLPLSVHFDVTYRCNERCVHCYLDHDDHGEMTTAEIFDVFAQLVDSDIVVVVDNVVRDAEVRDVPIH
jgi:MoaA/NifB/PqqE/SkfB family radical SAM enzyme